MADFLLGLLDLSDPSKLNTTMRISTGVALFGTLVSGIMEFGQVELRCKAYPVQPVVVIDGSGYFFLDESGKWSHAAGEFQPSPDRFEDILNLGDVIEGSAP